MNLLVRTGTHLKTVLPRTPANEWLGPMKEAPSFEGAFLFQVHPISGSYSGWGTGDGGGVVSGTDGRAGAVAGQALGMGGWVLLRERGTKPGTVDGDC